MWAVLAKAKKDIPIEDDKGKPFVIPEGQEITVTHGRNEKYALWKGWGIFDLPEEYVGEITKVYSES